MSAEPRRPDLAPGDQIKLMHALAHAKVEPFLKDEWSQWAGAMGNAHSVVFPRHLLQDVCEVLGIAHWLGDDADGDRVFAVLDDGGLTFNGWDNYGRGYVGAVTIELGLSTWYDVPEVDLEAERERDLLRLYRIHRAFVLGHPTHNAEIPKTRHDLRDYYGQILDNSVPKPGWVARGEKIQFGIADPLYDADGQRRSDAPPALLWRGPDVSPLLRDPPPANQYQRRSGRRVRLGRRLWTRR